MELEIRGRGHLETLQGVITMHDTDPFGGKLFTKFPSDQQYPENEKYQEHLLEQYKLYVEMADRVSARRQTANSYFLSINTALLGFAGYVTTKTQGNQIWLLGLVGIILSYLWYRIIVSYRDLNSAKFKVVHELEKRLPISPYDAEWEAMGRGKDSSLYRPLTHVEKGVPWGFLILHAFVVLHAVPLGRICDGLVH